MSHQHWVEGNHLPQPADNALPNGTKDAVGCLWCKGTLLAQLSVAWFSAQSLARRKLSSGEDFKQLNEIGEAMRHITLQ